MKNALRGFILLGAVLLAAGCGGGGDDKAGTPLLSQDSSPGTGADIAVTPSDLVLVLSAPTVVNTGEKTVTATVTALDAKRNVLPGAAVVLSVDANAIMTPGGTTTSASGVVTGEVGVGGDRSNRTITVTATSGTLVRTAQLKVTDTDSNAAPVASDLSLALSGSRLINTGTSAITATVTAVDANRNTLAGVPVTLRVDNSAVATVGSSSTSGAGVVTASVGIGADRSNRVVTVTALSGALTRSASFVVYGADLRASFAPRVNAGSKANAVEFTLVDATSQPMAGESVNISAPGLPAVSGTTDSNGKYVYTYDAPSLASALNLTAVAAGATKLVTIEVGSGTVDPAPSRPVAASITPSPSVVGVNVAGSTSNQVELRALFLGANNLPIPRVRARFDLAGNANNVDGTSSWLGGDYAYSDATGVARATFTPGQRSSPTNGVTVRVCYDITDFDIATCPNSKTSTLTVTQEAISVSLRSNEVVKVGASNLTYIREFVVMAVDAAGRAVPDVLITPSIDLTTFIKGRYAYNSTDQIWVQTVNAACPNEDRNRNGVLEVGEDANSNGSLDPRKSDVAVTMVNSDKTDASGLAVVQIEFGKSVATWVDFLIKVTATGILGTESAATYSGRLPATADSVTNASPPAFVVSPYGQLVGCSDKN